MSSLNIFSVGASRNIGYFTAIRLLGAGSSVTFLLRNPSHFDEDKTIQKFVSSGKVKLVKGDALVEDDCKRGWDVASQSNTLPVDFLIFSVGGTPSFNPTKGFVINPHNLVTQSFLNVICTLPPKSPPITKVICISSIGLTKTSYKSAPILLKPLYSWLIAVPHTDKLGMERVAAHIGGLPWNTKEDGEPKATLMGSKDWRTRKGLPLPASFGKNILVVRPAIFTDGECVADNPKNNAPPYRASTKELGGYTISRKDVAHFISKVVLEDWKQWEGKIANVGY